VKIAVFAPMPNEMVTMIVVANPGDFWTWRRANLKSFMAGLMDGPAADREAGQRLF